MLIDNPLNVATPFATAACPPPVSDPLPGLVPTPNVTFVALSVVTTLLFPSSTCTVTAGVIVAPATAAVGCALNARCVAVPAVKVTVALGVICRLASVVSVAVNTSAPAIVALTVNVAPPELSVVPCVVVMVGEPVPDVLASDTALPATGLP